MDLISGAILGIFTFLAGMLFEARHKPLAHYWAYILRRLHTMDENFSLPKRENKDDQEKR